MDIFRILSRGASIKKSKQLTDYALPSDSQKKSELQKEEILKNQIDKETDFFKTKKRDIVKEVEAEEQEEEEEPILKISNEDEASKFRKMNKSKVTGDDIPLPIGSFEDLTTRFKFDKKLLDNLIQSEFVEPTAIQCESIPIMLNNRDLIACAPTGSGKTLAYLIPTLQKLISNPKKNHGIRGLIISPTNELASQIFQNLEILSKSKNLRIAILSKQLATKLSNKETDSKKYDIIVTTPLRLIDVLKKESIDLSKVENLVIDEADKLFDQGFLNQTDQILSTLTNKKLTKSMFSATIPSGVEEIANTIMFNPIRTIIGHKESANNQIEQKLIFTGNEEGKLLSIRQLIQEGEFKPPIIIFLQSIIRAKALFHELLYDKLNVDVIHSEKTPKQRDEVIKRFKNGDIWVLITTDVIARGIDFKGVNLVINYDVPQTAQSYVHRIGRTGRGGKSGKAITFFTKEDNKSIKPIINVMKQSGSKDGYADWMEDIDKLSKNEKKKIKHNEIKRKKISTVPSVVTKKRKQREEMIEASKKRKALENSS
ncbi:ATP-dependent RNA helicase Rok1p [[Candida] jaroonii]|uniref:ATP-dependent RNA helicase Rok1p n=1 Tax=[Candida] jaroonii TaxID=467808 RepID=A0ACA9YC37_9ASCO|nr:ATP-dependent RNA helicase Rok1p [[Candida] jaroonii]